MTSSESADEVPPTVSGAVVMPADGVDPSWRRLSPRMLLVHPLLEIPRALPAIFGIFLAGSTSGNDWWGVASLGAVIVTGMLRWFTTTYRITPDYVQVRRGLLRRRELSVPRDRVRTVDVTANAIHRVVGLTRVEVGTGSANGADEGVRLDGLTAAEAARLREELLHRRPLPATAPPGVTGSAPGDPAAPVHAVPAVPDVEVELARLRPAWVRYGPFTLSGFVTVGVIGAFLSRAISESHVDPTRYGPLRAIARHFAHAPTGLAVAEVLAACVLVVAVASTLGYVLAFWGFRLTRHSAGTLHVKRGLITSRSTTIEERRLRGIEINEPLLLRVAGGARCLAIATGLRAGRGAEGGGTLLLPPAPRAESGRVAGEVLHDREPVIAPLIPHGPRAVLRRYSRALTVAALAVAVPVAGALWAGWPGWMWQVGLVALPVAALLAYDRARSLGHAFVGGRLVGRHGSLVRRRYALAREGIIGWNLEQSFFQRRAGLSTLTATTAAGHQRYAVPDVDLHEALRLAEEATPGLLTPFLIRSP
jgi:putative membrane protein